MPLINNKLIDFRIAAEVVFHPISGPVGGSPVKISLSINHHGHPRKVLEPFITKKTPRITN